MTLKINSRPTKKLNLDARPLKTLSIDGRVVYTSGTLPSEYTQVEYIEGTGTQYIATGIKPGSSLINKPVIEYKFSYSPNQEIKSVFFGTSLGNNQFMHYLNVSPKVSGFQFGIPYTRDLGVESNYIYRIILDISNWTITENGISKDLPDSNFSVGNSELWLLAHSGDSSRLPLKARLYGFKYTDGTSNNRNFIPCYRNADFKPGLYDIVNDVFYTNAGTGEFIIPTEA